MKKKQIKNYLKTVILLLGIPLLLWNCEKEKLIEFPNEELNVSGTKIGYITGEDIPEVINVLTSYTGKTSSKKAIYSKSLSYKKARIDIESILKVKDYNSIINYSFNIIIDDAPENEFYNLVINEQPNGELKSPYVTKYVVDNDALANYLANNKDFRYFKGKNYTMSFNSFFDNYDTSGKSFSDCPPDETTINNTNTGENGNFNDIPSDNFIQVDPSNFNYSTSVIQGQSFAVFLNSFNITTQEITSYSAIIMNTAIPITTTAQPINPITVNTNLGIVTNSEPVVIGMTITTVDNSLNSGVNSGCYMIIITKYSDNTSTTSQIDIDCMYAPILTKPAFSSKTNTCPDPVEGEIGVIIRACEFPYVKDAQGNCVKKPCAGDPVPNPEIAPQKGSSGTQGAMYGNSSSGSCKRYGANDCNTPRNKKHDGIDLKNEQGEPIFAMFDGYIYSSKYDRYGAGYNTRIHSTVNGKNILISYFHLQENSRILQTSNPLTYVKAGDIIGYQGDSGNLKGAIASGGVDSHIHIEVREHDGSNSWGYSHYNLVDPRDYLTTTIDNNGVSQANTNCN